MDNPAWRFSQCFGDKGDIENITEADIISTVEFDDTGEYLATGDRGGGVVLFERNENKKNCEYRFYTEFQSHDAEFDYLKSLEIEEKINKIKWLRRSNSSKFLLSTNDKTIKLWKVFEKQIKVVQENNMIDFKNTVTHRDVDSNGVHADSSFTSLSNEVSESTNVGPAASVASQLSSFQSNSDFVSSENYDGSNADASTFNDDGIIRNKFDAESEKQMDSYFKSVSNLKLPRLTVHDTITAAQPKKIYANAHAYHINSISVNSDEETFISADDLRINLWNLAVAGQSFNIVDIKPVNMEELTEVITSAEFHPIDCNLFMYASSKGLIKLNDMRVNSLCDNHARVFEEYVDPSNHNFFTEITSSISDVKFSPNGRYIASRDYMTVKIWDINMETEPVKTINIHEQLRDRLCDTYENDAIFDKFEVQFSGNSKSVMTGSYNNNFMIYENSVTPECNSETETENSVILQADKSAFKTKRMGSTKRKNLSMAHKMDFDNIDFKKAILHLSWHPQENTVAIAATNNLYIFSAH